MDGTLYLMVPALRKFYKRRIRKKLGANQECVVGRVELCAKFVKLLKGYGYGRRTQWMRRACLELYCLHQDFWESD